MKPPDKAGFDDIQPKEEKVLEIVREKAAAGKRVLVYTSWTRTDSQQKLLKLLTQEGYRTEILAPAVPPNKREEWVEKRVRSGLQVLITNPKCKEKQEIKKTGRGRRSILHRRFCRVKEA